MMRRLSIQVTTTVDRQELLSILEKNLAEHTKIVEEAKQGYLVKAKGALQKALEKIDQGELLDLSQHFRLRPPTDYSSAYKTVIKMMTMNQKSLVELAPDEFTQLIEDQWEWSGDFFGTNKAYSASASMSASQKGY